MQIIAASLTIAVLVASSGVAQPTDRVLHFTATSSVQDYQEIATVIRSITDIPQSNVDSTEKSLSLRGTVGQVALAEWLFTNLDKPVVPGPQTQNGAKHEYRVSDSGDDVVRLFYLTNPEVPNSVQEITTAVRCLGDIRRMFAYHALRAVAMRGTSEDVRLAEFLFSQMDKPAVARTSVQKLSSASSSEFRMDNPRSDLVRVFYIPNTKTIRDFQEVVTLVRSITDLRWAFTYNASRSVGVRGSGDQIAMAKWIFENLDAASAASSDPAAQHEYRPSSTSDDFVRIFYLTSAATPGRLQDTATQVRQQFKIRKLFTYNAPNAIAVRDTAQKIAQASRLIQEQDQ